MIRVDDVSIERGWASAQTSRLLPVDLNRSDHDDRGGWTAAIENMGVSCLEMSQLGHRSEHLKLNWKASSRFEKVCHPTSTSPSSGGFVLARWVIAVGSIGSFWLSFKQRRGCRWVLLRASTLVSMT